MIGIQLDEDPNDARAFRERHSLSYPVLFDRTRETYRALRRGDILKALIPGDTIATPYNVVLDRQGTVRYRGFGFDEKALRATVEELLR